MTDEQGNDQNQTDPSVENSQTDPTGEEKLTATYQGGPVDPAKFQDILADRSRAKKLLQSTSADLQAANARLAEYDEERRKAAEADMSEKEKLQAELQAERDRATALTAKAVSLEYENAAISANATDTKYVVWLLSEAAKTSTDATPNQLLDAVKESNPNAFGLPAAQTQPPIGAAAGGQGTATSTESDPLKRATQELEDAHKKHREMKISGARQDDLQKIRKTITDLTFKISTIGSNPKKE